MLKALPRSRAARAPVGVNTQIVCYEEDGGDCVSDKTTYAGGEGYCSSDLDFGVILDIATPELCYEECLRIYEDELVAIDWHPNGDCYCQDDCACMLDVGGDATTITRESAVGALPEQCIDDDDTSYGGYDDTYFGGYDDITYGGGRKLKSRKAQK